MKENKRIYYNNIHGLRNENVKLSYTEHQIKEIIKCSEDIEYFLSNYVQVIHPDKGVVPFILYDFEKDIINLYQSSKRCIIMSSRQSGKTISTTGYLLHYILFNDAKTIGILANKGETARKILSILKEMYLNLPIWLQQGVKIWNKTNIELENKSSIITSATSDNALRGYSCSVVYIDETAFIENWNEFYTSVYPIISAGKNTQIILSSTPFGLNHFAKLWNDAIRERNNFKPLKIPYTRVPGRDDEWAEKTKKEIGERKFRQEYLLEFLGSDDTLINAKTLMSLTDKSILKTEFDGAFKIYKTPEKGHKYILPVDPSEGKGQDYAVINIIDISVKPFEQVAIFRSNTIPNNILPFYIYHIGNIYNEGLAIVENNIGDEVIYILNYEYEYSNIFYWNKTFGIRTTMSTKKKGTSHLKYIIENEIIKIYNFDTIHELSVFSKQGNTYKAIKGEHDDIVMSLVLFAFAFGNKEINNYYFENNIYKHEIEKIEDESKFFGFFTNTDEIEKITV